MSEQEYRRKLVEHNTAVQSALAGTTEAVRQYLRRYRLDLYPLDWLHGEIAALEALSANRGDRTDAQRQPEGPPLPAGWHRAKYTCGCTWVDAHPAPPVCPAHMDKRQVPNG